MATYSATISKHATLVAATVDTVNFGTDLNKKVRITNRATTGEVYFTVNGVAPTVAGDNTYVVLAGQSVDRVTNTDGVTVVKLISSGATAYSVTAL